MSALPTLLIHGGAGTILRHTVAPEQERIYRSELQAILQAGGALLAGGGSALDAVTLAVRLLEDCPLFNAGKGSVYTSAGTHEMDAAVMDGSNLKAGAVACVSHLRNPVLAARLVMENSGHVLLAGSGAESFAAQHGAEVVAADYFHTEARLAQWLLVQQQAGSLLDHDAADIAAHAQESAPLDPDSKFGTVGAVALDSLGNLAAATSTGGLTNKLPGRVGDSPMLGAGCYADNRTAAMSATGTGEAFMRSLALHDIAARMQYAQHSLRQAAQHVILEKLPLYGGRGGMIGIDAHGHIVMPFNTEGMYRGFIRAGGTPVSAIYAGD